MKLRINESALDADVIDMFRSAFVVADDYVEFWYNMSEDQMDAFKKLGIPIKELYADLSKCVQKDTEPRRYVNDIDLSEIYNFYVILSDVDFEFVNARSDGWQADANDDRTIRVRNDKEIADEIIYHELGHMLLNQNPELENIVIMNPQNVLGTMRKKRNGFVGFDGAYGCYNSEEAFADSFMYYHCRPNNLKSNYPKLYEVIDKLHKHNSNIKRWVESQIDRYHEALATQDGDDL